MQDATAHPTTRQVSVAEAARELGISPETVRRWIKSGRLDARRAIRPQGTVWEVSLPVTTPRGVPPVTPVTGHSEASLSEPGHATPDEAWHPSPPLAHHTADAAALVASIARLIVELAEVRVISDRRADQLVGQAEMIGQLRAEVAALKAFQAQQDAILRPEQPAAATDAPMRLTARLRALAPWLLAALTIVAVIALLG
jgi:excisionase family DNA binding protein